MQAVIFNGPYDVSVETVPDPTISDAGDAIVAVEATAVCGSDLWTYRGQGTAKPGARIGHEFVGRIVATGAGVKDLAEGDWVIAPFRYSDGTCEYCHRGLQSSCTSGGFWGREVLDAGQGEYVRVPFADATLVRVGEPGVAPDASLVADLLTLADVLPTGQHAVTAAGVGPGATVVVVGDGAVGLCAVIAAKLAGAERVIMLGSGHPDRHHLASGFGADEIVTVRDQEAVAAVADLTSGRFADQVVECVGTGSSFQTALGVAGQGATVGYVGIPHGVAVDLAGLFARNVGIAGGLAPARHYLPRLLDKVLAKEVNPGRVFTARLGLAEAPQAYRLMDTRATIKALLTHGS